jgi:hypothetical protein
VDGDHAYWVTQSFGDDRGVVRLPRLGASGLTVNASEYWQQATPDKALAAGYFFIANGGATSSPEGVRLMAYDRSASHAYYCKIQLTYFRVGGSTDRQELAAAAGDFLTHLLPDLMLCLPDWVEVQQKARERAGKSESTPEAMREDECLDSSWGYQPSEENEFRWRRI